MSKFVMAIIFLAISWANQAHAMDPHRIYEQKCASCHARHASGLARNALAIRGGQLVAVKSNRELSAILPGHRGTSLTDDEIRSLIELFTRNISNQSLFQNKCIICHDRARDFARNRLIVDQKGVLKGRYSGYLIGDFLQGHGRLTKSEAAQMAATLKWQLKTREP